MPTYTAPTTRTTGELISAAIFNTDLVENIKYFKDAPVFAGNVTYSTLIKSTTALATPSALTATQATAFASTVSGSAIMGFGTTNDVSLMNRAGTVVLGIGPNTTTVNMTGLLSVTGFGGHSFSAAGAGYNNLTLTNTTSGAANGVYLDMNAGTAEGTIYTLSQGYSSGTYDQASSLVVRSHSAGGLSLASTNASGTIRFYSGGTTLVGEFITNGNFCPGVDAGTNLGSITKRWNTLFMSTVAIAGTTVVQNASGYLSLTTSSRRFKENITPFVVTPTQVSEYLALQPQWWDYKDQWTGAAGFIAEDLDGLSIKNAYGVSPFINYDAKKQAESNRDYVVLGMQHLVLQKHDATIQQLAARIAALETKDN